MNISRLSSLSSAVALALLLASCASGPKVEGTWKDVGATGNGNITAALDPSSIKKNGNFATFRDKKTVLKTNEERYVNTPKYKTAVGEWEINCRNKTYRLTALTLLDESGKILMDEKYTATNLRRMQMIEGSITENQWKAVGTGK